MLSTTAQTIDHSEASMPYLPAHTQHGGSEAGGHTRKAASIDVSPNFHKTGGGGNQDFASAANKQLLKSFNQSM